jgi:hypothetical protein
VVRNPAVTRADDIVGTRSLGGILHEYEHAA